VKQKTASGQELRPVKDFEAFCRTTGNDLLQGGGQAVRIPD